MRRKPLTRRRDRNGAGAPISRSHPESRSANKNDSADDRERKLKSGREKFVRVPAEKKKRRGGQTVERENFSFEEKTAKQNLAHNRGANAGNVQSGDRCIKKQKRNDERRRQFPGKPRHHRKDPQKARHNSNMKTSNGEQVERARLLKRLLNVLRRLMAQTENNAAQKILHVR